MAKRWLHTLDLSLDVSKWKNSARWKLAHAVMAAHPSPTELTQLQLEWFETQQDDSSEDEDSEEEQNLANEENLAQNSATGLLLLTWLAAHARGIQTLYLRICSLHSLPPLLNLRHLVLDCAVLKVPQNLPHDLALMTELQSLCIRAGSQRDDDELPDLPVLASLKHLRQLRLEGLVPHSLSLPPEAELHVLVYSHWSARHPVWHSVLPMLRSFAWNAWQLRDNRLQRKIPVVLKMPNSLTSVFLRTRKMGYGDQPLQMEQLSLSSARIFISCENACVDLWGGAWRHLCIIAELTLVLSSSQSSKRCLLSSADFYFEYSVLEGATSRAIEACNGHQGLSGRRQCLWKGAAPDQPVAFECACGACMGCLVKSKEVKDTALCV